MPRFVWLIEKKGKEGLGAGAGPVYFATLDADEEWTQSPYDALEFADEPSTQKWIEQFAADYDFKGAKPIEHGFEVITHTVEHLVERVRHLEETLLTLGSLLVNAGTGFGETDYEALRRVIEESREEYAEVSRS